MTDQHKKIGIGVIIVGILYFTPALMETVHNLFTSKPQPVKAATIPSRTMQPQNPVIVPYTSARQLQPSQQPLGPAAPYLGKWSGVVSPENRFTCTLAVEFTQHPETPNKLFSYSRLDCPTALPPFVIKQKLGEQMARRYTPEATVASGDFTQTPIHFQIDQNIGTGCAMKSITVTPFGSTSLSFAFEDECGKGDLILTRSR
jgi:hypothetical protein